MAGGDDRAMIVFSNNVVKRRGRRGKITDNMSKAGTKTFITSRNVKRKMKGYKNNKIIMIPKDPPQFLLPSSSTSAAHLFTSLGLR